MPDTVIHTVLDPSTYTEFRPHGRPPGVYNIVYKTHIHMYIYLLM